jgi:hypothetical protein
MRHKNYAEQIQVNINEEWELEWWPWRLGISKKELISAVKRVGPRLDMIKEYISRKH